ncbi:MAG: hypothetical protein J7L26_01205 [Candidatus Aminicenantes bacterium]|nr:hypothetical protein [Candidatus Aminicenantes bacterium]
MGDWLFAFFHLFLLLGVFVYTLIALFQRNYSRFALLAAGLTLYYFLVLHPAVKKEIKRKKAQGKKE